MHTPDRVPSAHGVRLAATVLFLTATSLTAAASPDGPSTSTSRPGIPPAVRAGDRPVLTLFERDLQKVTATELRAALTQAGGKRDKGAGKSATEVYDVSAIGLPGIGTLDLLFHQDQFVLATYHSSGGRRGQDEKLRKMLVEKYGQPTWYASENGTQRSPLRDGAFAGAYVGDGKYFWDFAGGMQLVFKQAFFGGYELTYLDPARFAALKKVASDADAEDARQQAHKKANAF